MKHHKEPGEGQSARLWNWTSTPCWKASRWLDFWNHQPVGTTLREQLEVEYEATFACMKQFARALQLCGAWCLVLSTNFVWIRHRAARGSGGSCFLGRLSAST